MPSAQATGTSQLLIQHNRLSSPYPASYSKQELASLPRKPTPAPTLAPKQTVAAQAIAAAPVTKPLVRPAAQQTATPLIELPEPVIKIATSPKAEPEVYQHLERTADKPEYSPLLEAFVGSQNPSNSRANIRIGYGKIGVDNLNTGGIKDLARLEQPGCLYVKTTVRF